MALSSEELTRQATHAIILVTDVYTRNIISCRDRKRIYLDKSAFILFPQNDLAPEKATCHPLSSPTQFPWLRQLWGLRPSLSFSSTDAPDLSGSSTTSSRPSSAARCSGVQPRGGGHEARPTGQGVSERELENSQAAQAVIVQHKHRTPSDKRMPGETQGEEGAVADEEAVTRGWEGLCPGELRNPCSSCCGRCITKMQTSPENQSRSWHICSLF